MKSLIETCIVPLPLRFINIMIRFQRRDKMCLHPYPCLENLVVSDYFKNQIIELLIDNLLLFFLIYRITAYFVHANSFSATFF